MGNLTYLTIHQPHKLLAQQSSMSSMPNSTTTDPIVDKCALHIEQLTACFQTASDKLNKQMRNGVVSPAIHVPVHRVSKEVDADTVMDKNCQHRINDALSEYLQDHTNKSSTYRGILIKPKGDWLRKVHIIQGDTYIGTTLKMGFYTFWPFA